VVEGDGVAVTVDEIVAVGVGVGVPVAICVHVRVGVRVMLRRGVGDLVQVRYGTGVGQTKEVAVGRSVLVRNGEETAVTYRVGVCVGVNRLVTVIGIVNETGEVKAVFTERYGVRTPLAGVSRPKGLCASSAPTVSSGLLMSKGVPKVGEGGAAAVRVSDRRSLSGLRWMKAFTASGPSGTRTGDCPLKVNITASRFPRVISGWVSRCTVQRPSRQRTTITSSAALSGAASRYSNSANEPRTAATPPRVSTSMPPLRRLAQIFPLMSCRRPSGSSGAMGRPAMMTVV